MPHNPYAHRIKRKTVPRYFLDGKGWASLPILSKKLARNELGCILAREIERIVEWTSGDLEDVLARAKVRAIAEMFPCCQQLYCCASDQYNSITSKWDRVHNGYSWSCRTARNKWITDRATEILAQLKEACVDAK